MPRSPASVRLLRGAAPGDEPACAGVRKILVAQLGYGRCLSSLLLLRSRILALRHFPEDAARFIPGHVWCPRRPVTTNRVPALAAIGGPILHDIRDRSALLTARAKAAKIMVLAEWRAAETH